MNWKIEFRDGKWLVVDTDGNPMSELRHATRSDAVGELKSVVDQAMMDLAAADDIDPGAAGARFHMWFEEGEQTVDKRILDPQSVNFNRPAPWPVMCMTENPEFGGHAGAFIAGVIDQGTREGSTLHFYGNFDAGGEGGKEAERLVRDGVLSWWSPDIGDASVDTEVIEEDEDGFPTDFLDHLTEGTFLGGTICPMQAITSARIEIVGEGTAEVDAEEPDDADAETDDEPEAEAAKADVVPLVAAAPPVKPPAEWFEDPKLEGPTPLTVTDDGRVYGHIAQWGVCHTGMQDRCVLAPHSAADYAYFLTGSLETEEGETVRVGQLTMGTGHADLHLRHAAAKAHYDGGPGAVQAADVNLGEDEHGIWCAGAARPDLTDEQLREFRALAISGDWRDIAGNMELVAALSVPVPGFPVTIAASGTQWSGPVKTRLHMERGECKALVAAGMLRGANRIGEASKVAQLESIVAEQREDLKHLRAVMKGLVAAGSSAE